MILKHNRVLLKFYPVSTYSKYAVFWTILYELEKIFSAMALLVHLIKILNIESLFDDVLNQKDLIFFLIFVTILYYCAISHNSSKSSLKQKAKLPPEFSIYHYLITQMSILKLPV